MDNTHIYDVETLLSLVKNGFQPSYLFFWGHRQRKDGLIGKQCLSHWWSSPFDVDNITYPTVEHFLMAEKARMFGDDETRTKILMTSQPGGAKALGRIVSNFSDDIWNAQRLEIAVQGNQAKFTQNEKIREYLLNTASKILVEASPVDSVWGIGLAAHDVRATKPEQWRGQNLLGFALMIVRSRLQFD